LQRRAMLPLNFLKTKDNFASGFYHSIFLVKQSLFSASEK